MGCLWVSLGVIGFVIISRKIKRLINARYRLDYLPHPPHDDYVLPKRGKGNHRRPTKGRL